jgi:hypothetical protein
MSSANVRSLDALRRFRAGLLSFAAASDEGLTALNMELRRGMEWLLEEQPSFWSCEQRRLSDEVLEARVALSRCRGMALPGEVAACSEQKQALEKALTRLRHAEDKAKATKLWGRVVEHEAHEWQARTTQFAGILERELPRAISFIDRAIVSLEAYLNSPTSGNVSTAPTPPVSNPPFPESPDAPC